MEYQIVMAANLGDGLAQACARAGAGAVERGSVLVDIAATRSILAAPYRQDMGELPPGVTLRLVHRLLDEADAGLEARVMVRVMSWPAGLGFDTASRVSTSHFLVRIADCGVQTAATTVPSLGTADLRAMAAMLD